MSEDVDKRLCENLQERMRLSPNEWASGEIHWLIDMIGPPELAHVFYFNTLDIQLNGGVK